MKAGDLVKLDLVNYPQRYGEIGMLIDIPRASFPKSWTVMIDGKMHFYTILEEDMEIINEVES